MTASDDAFLSIVRRLRGAASDAESAFLREEAGEPNAPADHFAAWLHSTIHRSRVPAADSGHEPWGDSVSADAASLYGCPSLAAERIFPAGMTCADLERELFVPIQLLWRMSRRASGRPLDAAGRRHFTDAHAVEWIAARPAASEFEGLMREANRILVKLNPGLASCLLGSGLDFEVDLFFGSVYLDRAREPRPSGRG